MPVIVDIYQSMIKGIKNQVSKKPARHHNSQNVNIQLYQRFRALCEDFARCFFVEKSALVILLVIFRDLVFGQYEAEQ